MGHGRGGNASDNSNDDSAAEVRQQEGELMKSERQQDGGRGGGWIWVINYHAHATAPTLRIKACCSLQD